MDFYESLDNEVIEQVIKSKDESKKNKKAKGKISVHAMVKKLDGNTRIMS